MQRQYAKLLIFSLMQRSVTAICFGQICISSPTPDPSVTQWTELTIFLLSNLVKKIYERVYGLPNVLPDISAATIALSFFSLCGVAAILYHTKRLIEGRHRTPEEKETCAAKNTTTLHVDNSVRVETTPCTSSHHTDNPRRADPSDQYGLITRSQGQRESLDSYCNSVRKMKDLFKDDQMTKFIFVRGLALDRLRNEAFYEYTKHPELNLEQFIDKVCHLHRVIKETEKLQSDYASSHEESSNQRNRSSKPSNLRNGDHKHPSHPSNVSWANGNNVNNNQNSPPHNTRNQPSYNHNNNFSNNQQSLNTNNQQPFNNQQSYNNNQQSFNTSQPSRNQFASKSQPSNLNAFAGNCQQGQSK